MVDGDDDVCTHCFNRADGCWVDESSVEVECVVVCVRRKDSGEADAGADGLVDAACFEPDFFSFEHVGRDDPERDGEVVEVVVSEERCEVAFYFFAREEGSVGFGEVDKFEEFVFGDAVERVFESVN